ncbi:bifunctional DNA primase/polymerase [Nonomuraea cavernae]|nr:bifunctional DNA primase/polymerase [Nonomuraea cavernae]MCA2187731.1 bifunctional DNA primase/polymerase [Nonomuraea cavernae]
MLAAALAIISQGGRVLICEPGGKAPLTRFLPNGVLSATDNPELASRWWRHEPNGNVAMATGHPWRDVLDIDVKPGGTGWPAFHRLRAAGLLPEPLVFVGTPSGGGHAHYVGTDQACGSLKRHFIDWKSSGGYVLTPPSVVDGRPYTLISERPEARAQLNWSSVRQFLDPPKPVRAAPHRASVGTGIDHLAAFLAGKTKPGRNQALFWAACRASENGASEVELHELYRAMQFGDGFDERQAARTVADAFRTTTRRTA